MAANTYVTTAYGYAVFGVAGTNAYINGASVFSELSASLVNLPLGSGGDNRNGTSWLAWHGGKINAVFMANSVLTAAQVAALSAAMAAL